MSHLDPERLAALADEAPTAGEGAHLATCLACRRERDAYVSLLALAQREGHAAADLAPPAAEPLTSWPALADALRAEGLLAPSAGVVVLEREGGREPARVLPLRTAAVAPSRRAALAPLLRRAAAAALFVAGGMAAGRASVGAPALPLPGATAAAPAVAVAAADAGDGAGVGLLAAGASPFTSVEHAARVLNAAQRDYQRAAAFLAEHDSAAVGSPEVLQARLAALDEVMPRVREALSVAPADPVLNQVYLTTYDVRESTLRQLGRTLPVGARVTGY
jgi:hypothetical protein